MPMTCQTFSNFNAHHWAAVAQERKRQGLSRESECRRLPQHPLLHARVQRRDDGRCFTVTSVFDTWRRGWFTSAVLTGDTWDELVILDARNCHEPQVQQGHLAFLRNFLVRVDQAA